MAEMDWVKAAEHEAYIRGAKAALIYTSGMVNLECKDCLAGMKRWRELDDAIRRGEWPKETTDG